MKSVSTECLSTESINTECAKIKFIEKNKKESASSEIRWLRAWIECCLFVCAVPVRPGWIWVKSNLTLILVSTTALLHNNLQCLRIIFVPTFRQMIRLQFRVFILRPEHTVGQCDFYLFISLSPVQWQSHRKWWQVHFKPFANGSNAVTLNFD